MFILNCIFRVNFGSPCYMVFRKTISHYKVFPHCCNSSFQRFIPPSTSDANLMLICLIKHLYIGVLGNLLVMWPYKVSCLSLMLSYIYSIPIYSFIFTFLILSLSVLPQIHHNICISATNMLWVCFLKLVRCPIPYSTNVHMIV